MGEKRKSVPRTTAAIHEAGHAVAAIWFSIGFDYVTVVPDETAIAYVQGLRQSVPDYATSPITKDDPDALAFWQQWLVMTMAGPSASAKWQPRLPRLSYAWGDMNEALRLLGDIHRNDGAKVRTAHYGYICALADDFVEKEWPRIEVVAAALVERGTLTYDDVRSLLHSARHAMIAGTFRSASDCSRVIHLGNQPRPGAYTSAA